ncbi:hypothetical protein [Microcystis phage Me-ZS1]|nr:hypothetical protein [Microcystis phage Me-ZS1]
MATHYVHVIHGSMFEDFYVKARNTKEAIAKVQKMIKGTALDSRWTRFVV